VRVGLVLAGGAIHARALALCGMVAPGRASLAIVDPGAFLELPGFAGVALAGRTATTPSMLLAFGASSVAR
jgi:hypothetical protein